MVKEKTFRLIIEEELHTDLKVLSAIEGKSMHQLITESIEQTITEATERGKLHKELKK